MDKDGEVLGYDDYYPFGLQMPGRSSNTANPNHLYKYSSKELDEEIGLECLPLRGLPLWGYYFGARYYYAEIGRFLSVDRFAGMYPDVTPYHYVLNNPMRYVDVNGDSVVPSPHPDIDYEETEPIVIEAERYSPSWRDPLTYGSYFLFGNRNYFEVLFNKEAGMSALAFLPVAFIPGGSLGKTSITGFKTVAIGFAKGTGKSVLKEGRLHHAARHLIDSKLIPAWNNTKTREVFENIVVNIVENPKATFDHILRGNTPVKGFVGEINGREVVVFISKGGQIPAGEIATVIVK